MKRRKADAPKSGKWMKPRRWICQAVGLCIVVGVALTLATIPGSIRNEYEFIYTNPPLESDSPGPVFPFPVSRVKACDGHTWFRLGKPYHAQHLKQFSFAFKVGGDHPGADGLPRVNQTMLLWYAQLLRGIFRPEDRQFVAVTLRPDGIYLAIKRRGNSSVVVISTPGHFFDAKWHTVTVILSKQGASLGQRTTGKGESVKLGSTGRRDRTSVTSTNPILVDSGLYRACVVDRHSLPLAHAAHWADVACFSGHISSFVVVNDNHQYGSSDHGVVDEFVWPHMQHVFKYDIKTDLLNRIKSEATDTTDLAVESFPVASALTSQNNSALSDMVESAVQNMKRRGILLYDLCEVAGDVVAAALSTYSNVALRRSIQNNHPALMNNLYDMRWKPFIVRSVILEFGGVLYADPSVLFKKSITDIGLLRHGPGFVGFETFNPKGTVLAGPFTHDSTMLSMDVMRVPFGKTMLTTGAVQIWLDRPAIRDNLLRPWMACAIHPACMAPKGSKPTGCKVYALDYSFCHRYDASALSVILFKAFRDLSANSYQVNRTVQEQYVSIDHVSDALSAMRC